VLGKKFKALIEALQEDNP